MQQQLIVSEFENFTEIKINLYVSLIYTVTNLLSNLYLLLLFLLVMINGGETETNKVEVLELRENSNSIT